MSVFMQAIYTQTVGAGGAASVTFNNIPQGYTDLKLVISARTTSTSSQWDSGTIFFNNDSSTNHFSTLLFGNGSTAGGNRDAGARGGLYSTNLTQANTFGNIEINIFKYSSGLFKTYEVSSIQGNNTSTSLPTLGANVWASTAPITAITLASQGGNTFLQNSTFTLYGVAPTFAGGTPTAPTLTSVTDEAGFVQVAFTPVANDQASSYAVTSIPSGVTTYGASSPIDTPAALNTSYAYLVSAVNDRGVSASSPSSSITTFNSFASIATFTVSSGTTTSFTFNNIPQQYKHLELRCIARSGTSTSTQIDMNFNGDGGNNYTFHQFYGTASGPGTSATSTGRSNYPDAVLATLNSGNQSGVSILKIQDYALTTKHKTVFQLYGFDFVGTGTVQFTSGMWMSTAPITSITFTARTQNIGNFTQIALYGIA